jgi:hypothetical protein
MRSLFWQQIFDREVKMKRYRRIEITAFRRRVQIVSSSNQPSDDGEQNDTGICLTNAETEETIETESAEGQRILTEAVRFLEEKLIKKAGKGF